MDSPLLSDPPPESPEGYAVVEEAAAVRVILGGPLTRSEAYFQAAEAAGWGAPGKVAK